MAGECNDCRKLEEDIYWTRFQSVQFFQFLSGSFDHQLEIPKKFATNLREKLADTIALKGPSGSTWNVGLTTSGDDLLLKHGWKEFIVAHSLEEDDILIFKYNGGSHFEVLMFDGRNLCEKEASYFVRKCRHVEPESGRRKKRITIDSFQVRDAPPHDVIECTSSKKLSKLMPLPEGNRPRAIRRTRKGVTNRQQALINTTGAYFIQFASNRRDITEVEKETALQQAQAASTEDSFIVVMRPSHVYKGFFMSIPTEWSNGHLSRKIQDVILRVGEKTWNVRIAYRARNGGLLGGWKKFAVENFLEEFDVCLFELASGGNGLVVLDVKIFRVVEEVVPPTRLARSPARGRKPSRISTKK